MAHNPDSLPEGSAAGISGGPDSTFRLLERVRAGDAAALDGLFGRFAAPLRRWARGRLPQHARDVADTNDLVQETLLQTFKRIDAFEPRREGAFYAYLRQALMNRIRDELRRHRRRAPQDVIDSGLPDDGPSPLEHAIGREAAEEYEHALDRLRPEEREIIFARVELGCSYEDLAQVLGKPSVQAARKAAQRALVRLAVEMNRGARS